MKKWLLFSISHALLLGVGFLLGLYFLPILAAPKAPTAAEMSALSKQASYTARFQRDLKGSDLMHWGEGELAVGQLAPGPAYRLYLTREHVDTADGFLRIKSASTPVGDIKTFNNFMLPVPSGVDVSAYVGVVIWCESFQRFITSARYR
jgi:hypothetical protein